MAGFARHALVLGAFRRQPPSNQPISPKRGSGAKSLPENQASKPSSFQTSSSPLTQESEAREGARMCARR